jgi:hypothetical protein
LDGSDLRNFPIETRKATLASLLRKPGALRLSEHIAANDLRVFAHACRSGARVQSVRSQPRPHAYRIEVPQAAAHRCPQPHFVTETWPVHPSEALQSA